MSTRGMIYFGQGAPHSQPDDAVYKHHDNYPKGTGQDLQNIAENGGGAEDMKNYALEHATHPEEYHRGRERAQEDKAKGAPGDHDYEYWHDQSSGDLWGRGTHNSAQHELLQHVHEQSPGEPEMHIDKTETGNFVDTDALHEMRQRGDYGSPPSRVQPNPHAPAWIKMHQGSGGSAPETHVPTDFFKGQKDTPEQQENLVTHAGWELDAHPAMIMEWRKTASDLEVREAAQDDPHYRQAEGFESLPTKAEPRLNVDSVRHRKPESGYTLEDHVECPSCEGSGMSQSGNGDCYKCRPTDEDMEEIRKVDPGRSKADTSSSGMVPHKETNSRIFVWPKGEGLMDNLQNRHGRPHDLYQKALPEIKRQAGIPESAEFHWDPSAGCKMCPCSPGFVSSNHHGSEVHSEVSSPDLDVQKEAFYKVTCVTGAIRTWAIQDDDPDYRQMEGFDEPRGGNNPHTKHLPWPAENAGNRRSDSGEYAEPGSISSGTTHPRDTVPAMLDELGAHEPQHAAKLRDTFNEPLNKLQYGNMEYNHEDAIHNELVPHLEDRLQKHAPPGHYFGTHPDDPADLGFWPHHDD